MEIIERTIKGQKRNFKIYELGEANKFGMTFVPWREATKDDEWVLLDDDYVAELFDVKVYPNKGRKSASRYVMTSSGNAWASKYSRLGFQERRADRAWSLSAPGGWVDREAKRSRSIRAIRVYAKQILAGRVDYEKAGKVMRPSVKNPAKYFKKFLKEEKIQKMVDKEIDRLLESSGFTKEFAIHLLMEAVEAARTTKKPLDLLRVAEAAQELVGLKGNRGIKTVTTEKIEASRGTLRMIEDESAKHDKVKLERKLEVTE